MSEVFDVEELETAFRHYWHVGMIREDWNGWCDLFTEDVDYLERVYGAMKGRETVRAWIVPVMEKYREIYGVYEWHVVDPRGRVTFYMQNRRDHPSGEGYVDFPGISILTYAGNGQWKQQEDYWAQAISTTAYVEYEKALKKFDPEHRNKATRLDWGKGPDWTIGPKSFWDHPRG
jgi:hypothetical protein